MNFCKNLVKKYNKTVVASILSFHGNKGEVYGLLWHMGFFNDFKNLICFQY